MGGILNLLNISVFRKAYHKLNYSFSIQFGFKDSIEVEDMAHVFSQKCHITSCITY